MAPTQQKQLPKNCPSCGSALAVQKLVCNNCQTGIEGNYDFALLARLGEEDQRFILEFIKNSGSLKAMAEQLNRSYPSVRNYLNDLIDQVKELENNT